MLLPIMRGWVGGDGRPLVADGRPHMTGGGVDTQNVAAHIVEWQPIGAEELDAHLIANWTPMERKIGQPP